VGKNAVLVSTPSVRVLLDYGVDISGEEPQLPLHVRPRDVDFVVLTHAHLDHSGAIPLLYISGNPQLLATGLTLELSEILINDFLKLSKYYAPYESRDVQAMRRNFSEVKIGDEVEHGKDVTMRFHEAGHIPGSAMVMLSLPEANVLYTGDFNSTQTCLLRGADIAAFREADVIIMEATYAQFDHPPRDKVEKNFVEDMVEVLDSGGRVLIPAFAVGRSQEVMCLIAKYNLDYPVFIDGMARKVIDILKSSPESLVNPQLFEKACSMVREVRNWRDRREAIKEPSIIISPAAMLKGGASLFYVKRILDNPEDAIFFVSYLMPQTPARRLLETGVFEHETLKKEVKARVEWYDLSSHCGRRELLNAVRQARPEARIVVVHSEEGAGASFVSELREQGFDVVFPREGEELTFR